HFPTFFQQHLSRTCEASAMAATIENLNIEIAFETVNGIAERRGRLVQFCRRRREAALFIQGIENDENIQQWFHTRPLAMYGDALLAECVIPMASPADRDTGI